MVSRIVRAMPRYRLGGVLILCLLGAAGARAECACLCLDGTYQTVCSSLDEMRAAQDACQAQAGQGCPVTDAAPARRYEAPLEGAANCRDAAIYDPATDRHLTARVCDALR